MESLKEFTIVETFKSLDSERQRVLLETLTKEANLASVVVEFSDKNQSVFYEFMRKEWPRMSLTFFHESYRRWDFLKRKAYGGEAISCADVGDFYIYAKSLSEDYSDIPFSSENSKSAYFNVRVPTKCDWRFIFITMLKPGDKWSTNYSVKDLMELDTETFHTKMIEYGFIAE
jgi:hypothetical protein